MTPLMLSMIPLLWAFLRMRSITQFPLVVLLLALIWTTLVPAFPGCPPLIPAQRSPSTTENRVLGPPIFFE